MRINVTPENYAEVRAEFIEKNSNLVGVVLRPDEVLLDHVISDLKQAFKDSCDGDVPYNMPMLKDKRIAESKLYTLLQKMPKGSDLHVHGTSILPVRKMIDWMLEEDNLLIDVDTCCLKLKTDEGLTDRCMPIGEAFYKGYISRKDIETKWTVLGCSDEENIWSYFEGFFDYTEAIDRDFDMLYRYYLLAFRDCVKNGIYHIEIHILFSSDDSETEKIVTTIRNAYYEVKKESPELIISLIGSSMKIFHSLEESEEILKLTRRMQEQYRDESDPENPHNFIIGFDLINEEDNSRALKEYAPILLRFKEQYPDFNYYLHCGESLEAQSNNLIDAYLIRSSRVGHGMNLFRYPNLLKLYCDDEICLECCPISNQTLRYTKDLRLHPGSEYLKRGVTIALCSDDPIFQEREQLTDDFFAAVVSWDLGIAEIKQLCLNSILYSGLDDGQKHELIQNWNTAWKEFVKENCDM